MIRGPKEQGHGPMPPKHQRAIRVPLTIDTSMAELSFQIARQAESMPHQTAGTFIPLRHFTKMILRGFDWTPRLFEQKHRMDNHNKEVQSWQRKPTA
jgi:hypothetical protein